MGTIVLDTIRFNVVRLRCNSILGALEVKAMHDYTQALRAEIGDVPIFAYVEAGEHLRIDRAARREVLAFARQRPWIATAAVDARYEVRVVVELTMNAIRLLVKEAGVTKFFDTKKEAMAWLEELGAAPHPDGEA